MPVAGNPVQILSKGLCPWLQDAFAAWEDARRRGHLGHAWLITGPPGIGKINLALALAERVLNPSGQLPQTLSATEAAAAQESLYAPADHRPDLYCIFPQEQRRSIGIDQIREACQQLVLSSLHGVAKVMVVEPAEYLTTSAANALLKTLEEPTPDTYLLLVSHQPGRLPATIRSRCQVLSVPCPPAEQVLGWLETSGIQAGSAALSPHLRELTPFQRLRVSSDDTIIDINNLIESIEKIIKKELDPQLTADHWLKSDPVPWLEALAAVLRETLRVQLATGASNPVTVSGSDRPHTIEAEVAPRQLFAQLDQVENWLVNRGSGMNEDLALRVILLGFQSAAPQQRSM